MGKFPTLFLTVAMMFAAVAFTPAIASADTVNYVFSSSSSSFSTGELTVTGTEINSGEFLVGSGTITLFGSTLPATLSGATGVLIPVTDNSGSASGLFPGAVLSPLGGFYFDDLFFVTGGGSPLDSAGLLFSVGGTELNVFANGAPISGGLGYTIADSNGAQAVGDFIVNSPTVPEPTPLLLLGTVFAIVVLRKMAATKLAHCCG